MTAALGALWTDARHREEVHIAEREGALAGMIVLARFPRRNAIRRWREMRHMARAFGWWRAIQGDGRMACLGWERGLWPEELYLAAWIVDRPHRGQGVGRALIAHAEQVTRLHGLFSLAAHAHAQAQDVQAALRACGFEPCRCCQAPAGARRAVGHGGLILFRKELSHVARVQQE
jgi:GNAT superfamily N-acetyltransferase